MNKVIQTVLNWLGIAAGLVKAVTVLVPGTGNIGAVIARDLTNDAAALHNYESGQAVLIADVTVPGESKRGVLILCQQDGPAYNSLFGEITAAETTAEEVVHPADLHGGIATDGTATTTEPAPGSVEAAKAADPFA